MLGENILKEKGKIDKGKRELGKIEKKVGKIGIGDGLWLDINKKGKMKIEDGVKKIGISKMLKEERSEIKKVMIDDIEEIIIKFWKNGEERIRILRNRIENRRKKLI